MGFFLLQAALSAAAVRYVAPRHPSSVRCGSHGATAAAFQGIPFVAGTNGVFGGACVSVCHLEQFMSS